MPATTLETLQQQIRQREQELEALRQQLQSRQTQLATLTRRKEKLQNQLQEVDAEIAALTTAPGPKKPARPTPSTASPTPAPAASAASQPKLRDLMLAALRQADKPLTARQLLEEAQKRGYQPSGRDPIKSIDARIAELKSKGLIQRAIDQPGYILASSTNAARKKSKTSRPTPKHARRAATKTLKSVPTTKNSAPAPSSPRAATMAKSEQPGGQPLRVVLTDILKSSRKPLSGSELAEQALAAGYKSNAKKFVDTVWAILTKMDNVEHVPDQGYRLKTK
jgi:hypothetical protein